MIDERIMKYIESKNYVFSKREMECLDYLLQGYTFKMIGRAMGLSPRTIEAYVKNMRLKVGAKNKKALVDRFLASM